MAGLKNCQGNISYIDSNKTYMITSDSMSYAPTLAPGISFYPVSHISEKSCES